MTCAMGKWSTRSLPLGHPARKPLRPLPPDVRAAVACLVRERSVCAVARTLGLPQATVCRLAGGLDVRPGTLALARDRLAALRIRSRRRSRRCPTRGSGT